MGWLGKIEGEQQKEIVGVLQYSTVQHRWGQSKLSSYFIFTLL